MVNPLIGIVPAAYRKTAYGIFALIGLVLGAIQVGYGAASAAQPTWLVVALAVYAFVGGALGVTAWSNTQPDTSTSTTTTRPATT